MIRTSVMSVCAPSMTAMHAEYDEKYPEQGAMLDECIYKLQKFVVRRWLLDDGKRVDGRGMDEIRPLAAEVGLIPRVHGSGMFTRGQTQVLTIATLGTIREAQILDGIDERDHQALYASVQLSPPTLWARPVPAAAPAAARSVTARWPSVRWCRVIPCVEEFPYAMRLVSEVLSSNGSTSQGSICGSTLALMDAGVPIKAPVAGISCGLITEGDRWMTMVDIQGVEDFFGDMDFKVGGTKKGITAIQMDIKIDGLTPEIIKEAFAKTHKARNYILDEVMLKAIPAPRPELSKYAPKMLSIDHRSRIRFARSSAPAARSSRRSAPSAMSRSTLRMTAMYLFPPLISMTAARAINIIETIAKDPEVGAIYKGNVTRLMNFGAFVEIAPGKEGLGPHLQAGCEARGEGGGCGIRRR